jgi:lysophospholipase L1-like esterase
MSTVIQLRRGSVAEWTSANPVLGQGEPGFETDTSRHKIGDGSSHWSDLPYFVNARDIAAKRTDGTTAFAGDSITAAGYTAPDANSGPMFSGRSWTYWACLLSGGRLRFGGVFATPGFTTAQVLDVHIPAILAQAVLPQFCTVLCGTNDGSFDGRTIGDALTKSNLTAIWTALANAGITPVLCTLTPRNDFAGSKAVVLTTINAWIRNQARINGWPLVDLHGQVVDVVGGGYAAGLNFDDVHPSDAGAKMIGQHVADVLAPTLPLADPLLADYNNYYTANIVLDDNPLFLNDDNSDGNPDGMSCAGTPAATGSLTPVADGQGLGNWWNISGSAGSQVYNSNRWNAELAPGHRMLWSCRIKTSNIVATGASIRFRIVSSDFSSTLAQLTLAQDAPAGSLLLIEFVVPQGLTDTSGKMLLQWDAGSDSSVVSIAQLTTLDLDAIGA